MLRQLSRDTADSLAREIEEALKRPHIDLLLRPGQQARLNPPDFAWLDTVFAEGLAASPFIEELWLWSENADGRLGQVLRLRSRQPATRRRAHADQRFRESPPRHAQIVPMLRGDWARSAGRLSRFPTVIDGRQKYVQVQLGFTGRTASASTRLARLHGRCRGSAHEVLPER